MANDLLSAQRTVFMSSLTSTEKLVLLAVLAHWSRDASQPFPGIDRIAKWTSLTGRAVTRILHALEAKGAIGIIREPGRSNRYDLSKVFSGALNPCPTVTPDTGAPLTIEQGTPDIGSGPPLTQGHPNGSSEGIQRRDPVGERARALAADAAPTQLALVGSAPPPVKAARRKATKKTKPTKTWRRVPGEWTPNDEHRALALKEGRDFERELRKFRNHEFSKGRTDADATFSNWLMSDFGGPPRKAYGRPAPQQSDADAVAAVLARAATTHGAAAE